MCASVRKVRVLKCYNNNNANMQTHAEPRPLYPPGGAEDPHAPAKPMLSLLSNLSQNVAARAKSGRNNINSECDSWCIRLRKKGMNV